MYRRFLVAGLAKWIAETTATATSPNLRSVKPTSADLFRIAEGYLRGGAADRGRAASGVDWMLPGSQLR